MQSDSHLSPTQPIASLSWNRQGGPESKQFDDVYFSSDNGLEESRYVFLQHSKLLQRWQNLSNTDQFIIVETGFGTGLNLLATWQLWQQHAPTGARLHYVSVEKYPLAKHDLIKALRPWSELAPLAEQLIAAYPAPLSGFHRRQLHCQGSHLNLTLIYDDAEIALQELENYQLEGIDAWFLDGFTPARNPELWTPKLFAQMRRLSKTGTSVATFASAAVVKQGLKEQGFEIKKAPGYGKKREMLTARYSGLPPTLNSTKSTTQAGATKNSRWRTTPWSQLSKKPATPNTVAVIGAGLAGTSVARALAERGCQVELIDRHDRIAQEASGNRQGLLFTKLSHRKNPLSQFASLAYTFTLDKLRQLDWSKQLIGDACGQIQIVSTEQQSKIAAAYSDCGNWVQVIDAQRASELAGMELPNGGLWFADGGWIQPASLCHWFSQHDNIRFHSRCEIQTWQWQGDQWLLSDGDGNTVCQADAVVIATANGAREIPMTANLPLKPVRGQVTHVPMTAASQQLKVAISTDRYIAPAWDNHHCVGATFDIADPDPSVRPEDHRFNLEKLQQHLPEVANALNFHSITEQQAVELQGRTAFRCTTPDYLPIVGPIPDWADFNQTYQGLNKNRKRLIPTTSRYQPNLYCCVGLGSRGATYGPLCGEILAAYIYGEVAPVSNSLLQSLHPARFQIRQIIRGD